MAYDQVLSVNNSGYIDVPFLHTGDAYAHGIAIAPSSTATIAVPYKGMKVQYIAVDDGQPRELHVFNSEALAVVGSGFRITCDSYAEGEYVVRLFERADDRDGLDIGGLLTRGGGFGGYSEAIYQGTHVFPSTSDNDEYTQAVEMSPDICGVELVFGLDELGPWSAFTPGKLWCWSGEWNSLNNTVMWWRRPQYDFDIPETSNGDVSSLPSKARYTVRVDGSYVADASLGEPERLYWLPSTAQPKDYTIRVRPMFDDGRRAR